jgi:hypothetical protein
MGNQRTQVGDYDLTADGIETTDRRTGLLTAFETNAGYSYATVDLSAAYPSSTVKSMERRLLFMHGGAILVLDRLTAMKLRSLKTWHLQLPVRPELVASIRSGRSSQGEGAGRDMRPYDLSQVRQIHGVDHHAGIWEADRDMDWLLVTHGEGRLFVKTLMPSDARRRVVGGPMHSRRIFGGPLAEMLYCGGDLLGYENRLWPASIPRAPNASYSLGSPTSLGPNFGVGQTWGRLDVFPPEDVDCMDFLHLLIPTDAKTAWPPAMRFEVKEEVAMIDLRLGKQDSHIELKLGAEPGGRVVIQDSLIKKVIFDKALATTVEPNLPIPR